VESKIGGKSLWQDVLKDADITGRRRGSLTPVAITMTPGLPLVNTMTNRKEIATMKFNRKVSCETCYNVDQDTESKVACCNCCEDYDFYIPDDEEIEDEYTLADLGRNWW
jgi:hypothetical protein